MRASTTPRAEALRLLEAHDWPGNIRELRHAAERAAIIGGDERLEPQDFPFLFAAPATGAEEQFDLDQLEKETIGRAMVRFNGNISMAATALGLTRPALYRRLEKHGF
jgi:transcriptional regulator of acetoin/glycerol metabolism